MNTAITHAPRLSPQPRPEAGRSGRMSLLHRAKWNVAVLGELATPGHMELAPIFDGEGKLIDFIWREASPTSTLAFGCAGQDLVGRTLKQVLAECPMDASVFASYRAVFLQKQPRVLRVGAKDGVTMHCIAPLPSGLTVEVTCVSAMDRVLSAQRALRMLE